MAPRDAFGREIGEDAPGVTAPAPTTSGDSPTGLSSASRTVLSAAVVLLIVAGITAAVIVGIGAKDDGRSSGGLSVGTSIEVPSTAAPPQTEGTAPPPRRSLIDRHALAGALRKLHGRGRLRLLRVAPDRVDAQLVTRAGALRNVQVTADGALRDFGAAGAGAGGLPTIAFGEVDASAPSRIVRVAARRAGRKPSRVDYLVLLKLPTGQSWNVYFKPDSLHFMADRHGTGLRRL